MAIEHIDVADTDPYTPLLTDLQEEIAETEIAETETPAQRIERITKNLKSAFETSTGEKVVKWDNFIQWCRHETGNFYSNSVNKTRKAIITCDQYSQGTEVIIDRNASNTPLTVTLTKNGKTVTQVLTRNRQFIYGGYNYTNISAESMHMRNEEKNYGSMASQDVEVAPNGEKIPIKLDLYIFENDQHFVTTMLERLQFAGVTNQDDMMTMMAKLSAMTGFNGYGKEKIIKYANSGYLRETKYITGDKSRIKCVLPTGWQLSQVRDIIKMQLDTTFMKELASKCPNLYTQYDKFLNLDEKKIDMIQIPKGSEYPRAQIKGDTPKEEKTYTIIELPDLSKITF